MSQVLGIVDLYYAGNRVDVQPGSTFMLGGMKNTTVIFGRQVGRAQKMFPGEVNGTTVLKAGQTWASVFQGSDVECQVHCDTGQIFVSASAFLVEDPEFTAGDSHGVKFKINGSAFTETT